MPVAKKRPDYLLDAPRGFNLRYGRWAGLKLSLVLSALLVPAYAGGAEVYKWVDDDGTVYYGAVPPSYRDAESVHIAPSPSNVGQRRAFGGRDGLGDWRPEDAKIKRDDVDQVAAREEEARERRCGSAKRLLDVLKLDRPVYFVDEKGERVYLDDEGRKKEVERAKSIVKDDCR